MAFANAQNINVYGGAFADIRGDNYNIENLSISQPELGLLSLYKATSPGAAFNSQERYPPPECHPGTREEILEGITNWIVRRSDEDGGRVLWLHGPAGAGKSAIAQTIAEACAENEILAASFFFSRGRPGRDCIDRLFTTVAYQLAMSIPSLRSLIQQILIHDPSIISQVISVQVQKLIIEPLQALALSLDDPSSIPVPSLVIIDGLDECTGKDHQCQILNHVHTLASTPHVHLRFLIVSRPEYYIHNAFEKTSLSNFSSQPISLYGDFKSREDVRTYLLHEFDRIHSSDKHEPWMANVPKPWPSTPTLDLCVKRSDGYFIYASTLVKFVDQEALSPLNQLDIVLNPSSSASEAFAELDKLYRQVLSTNRDIVVLKMVLGAVLADVPSEVIADLYHLEPGQVSTTLRGLRAVLHEEICIDNYYDTPHPFHASFSDFIFDSTRAGPFHIDHHTNWAESTRVMLASVGRCSRASEESLLIGAAPGFLMAADYSYERWFHHFTKAGPHQDTLAEEIITMDPHCWVPFASKSLPLHAKKFSNLKAMYVCSLAMLLKTREDILCSHHDRDDLVQYFAVLRDMAFKRLLTPLCSQDRWIVYAITTDPDSRQIWADYLPPKTRIPIFQKLRFSDLNRGRTIGRLLRLERPFPYHTLEIYEFLIALDSSFSASYTRLEAYLASKNAPPELFVDRRISHAHLASCCMTFLTADVDEVLLNKSVEEYEYARRNWATHLSQSLPGDQGLLDHLRSIDRQYLFDTEYFSEKISYVKRLEQAGGHFFPKGNCNKCRRGQELTDDEHDRTVLRLSKFNYTLDRHHEPWKQSISWIEGVLLQNDMEMAQKVLTWLTDHPNLNPPEDLVQRRRTFHEKLSERRTSKPKGMVKRGYYAEMLKKKTREMYTRNV